MEADFQIRHAESAGGGAFVLERAGERVGEMAYRRGEDGRIVIFHTEVDPSLRRRGLARQLLDALLAWARESGAPVGATCPYAKVELEKDGSLRS